MAALSWQLLDKSGKTIGSGHLKLLDTFWKILRINDLNPSS
jgi:hypothetical protein